MLLLGCTPKGRHTEQHDIFFGIGEGLKELVPGVLSFWPEADGKIHLDAWREVTWVNGNLIKIIPRSAQALSEEQSGATDRLFFLNLGGYKEKEFEEYHYKVLTVAKDKGVAIQMAKHTAFYKHIGFTGAESHIDNKYGVDVDDIYDIEDILPPKVKENYTIQLVPSDVLKEDELHIGYVKLGKV